MNVPASIKRCFLVCTVTALLPLAACDEKVEEDPDRPILCAVDQPYPYADVTYASNHVGPLNSDYIPCPGPLEVEASWHVLQTHLIAQPNTFSADGKTAYVTSSPGDDGCTVHALSTWDGRFRWQRCDFTYAVAGSAVEVDEDDTLYVTDRNELHALDATNGRDRWSTTLPDADPPGLVYGVKFTADGHIVTQTGNGTVYLVDRADGAILAFLDVAAETGYVPPATLDIGGDILPDFVLERAMIMVGEENPTAAEEAITGLFGGSGAFADNTVVTSARRQVITVGGGPTPELGAVAALNIGGDVQSPTLTLAWTAELPAGSASSVALTDGGARAVLADGNGTIHMFDAEACDDNTDADAEPTRCATAWSFAQPGTVPGSVSVTPAGDIYFISTPGDSADGADAIYALHDAGDHAEVRWTRRYGEQEMFTTVLTVTENAVYGLLTDIDPMFTIEGLAIPIPASAVSNRIVILDPENGDILFSLPAPNSSITELILSPHGDLFLTMSGIVETVVMDPNAPDPVAGMIRFAPPTE